MATENKQIAHERYPFHSYHGFFLSFSWWFKSIASSSREAIKISLTRVHVDSETHNRTTVSLCPAVSFCPALRYKPTVTKLGQCCCCCSFFFRISKMSFYTVLDQEHLRTIKNIHFFEQNELANIELNIPKSFSLNFKPLTGPSL